MQQVFGTTIEPGSFVELRGRPWLVEDIQGEANELQTLNLSCISDDDQGERLEIIWDAEIGAVVLDEDGWRNVGASLPDRAEVLAAHLRAIRWRSATAADRDLLQAPFRAGIRLDAYQLLPLRKALRLPRVTRVDLRSQNSAYATSCDALGSVHTPQPALARSTDHPVERATLR